MWSYPDIPVFPNSATISRYPAGQWFVSLQCDCVDAVRLPETAKTIGLDLGLRTFIATSDGDKIKPPKYARRAARKLKLASRRLRFMDLFGKGRYLKKRKILYYYVDSIFLVFSFLREGSRKIYPLIR